MATRSWQTGPKGGKYYLDAAGEKRYGQDAVEAARRDTMASLHQAKQAKAGAAPAAPAKEAPKAAGKEPERGEKALPPQKREWVEKLDHLPDPKAGGTMSVHFSGSTFDAKGEPIKIGTPTPERKALHDDIKTKAFAAAPRSLEKGPNGKPVAIVTMGGPGSGKSKILESMGKDLDDRFVKIDSDAVKGRLPEYREATRMDGSVGKTAKNAAALAHEESSYVAKSIRDEAIKGGHNLVFDGTGKSVDSYHKMIKQLKDSGYHVNVVMADVDMETGRGRANARAEKTGRHVPDHVVDDAYSKIPKNFEPIAEMADDFALFNNNGKSARPIYVKSGGQTQTFDKPYLEAFRANKPRAHITSRRVPEQEE